VVNIQDVNIRAGLDVLEVSPPNTNLPRLDETDLKWVYPVSPEFMPQGRIAFRSAAISINAANVAFDDDNSTTNVTFDDEFGAPVIATTGRSYIGIRVVYAGGAVTPIETVLQLQFTDPAGTNRTYIVTGQNVTNPGEGFFGPFWAPPGVVMSLTNVTQGGVGDTIAVQCYGNRHLVGTPVPFPPTPSIVGT